MLTYKWWIKLRKIILLSDHHLYGGPFISHHFLTFTNQSFLEMKGTNMLSVKIFYFYTFAFLTLCFPHCRWIRHGLATKINWQITLLNTEQTVEGRSGNDTGTNSVSQLVSGIRHKPQIICPAYICQIICLPTEAEIKWPRYQT